MFKPTKPQHVTNKNYVDKLAKSLPSELPTEDGTYTPNCVVEDGEATVTWVAENSELPTEDGTYISKCVVVNGEATVTWVAESNGQ